MAATLFVLFLCVLSSNAVTKRTIPSPNKLSRNACARIVNGIETTYDHYPFLASLFASYGWSSVSHFCGGSIIRKEYPALILTAAHCFHDDPYWSSDTLYGVHLGRNDIDEEQSETNDFTTHSSLGFILHEQYESESVDNDIAIMVLNSDLTEYNDRYQQVILPQDVTATKECCSVDEKLQVIGYGADYSNGPATDKLEYTNLHFVNRQQCNDELVQFSVQQYYQKENINYTFVAGHWNGTKYVTNNMICAQGEDTDACQGDSGGPLIKTNSLEQIGIVSWGFNCSIGIPAIYTNLGLYYDWIQDVMNEYSTDSNDTTFEFPCYSWMDCDGDTDSKESNTASSRDALLNICFILFIIHTIYV